MKIDSYKEDDVIVLRLSGNIMAGGDYELMHGCVKAFLSEGYRRFVYDMSNVTWLNSTGNGILVSSWHSIKNSGGALALAIYGVPKRVQRLMNIFEVTQLNLVFNIHSSVEESIAVVRAAKVFNED